MSKFLTLLLVAAPCMLSASAVEPTPFKSELFKTGTLVYSDDFDGQLNRERWGVPKKKDRQIKDGKLVVTAQFKSKEEAMKTLKRDHHLGLEPVIHLNRIPQSFVCHLRYKFETEKVTPGRPSFQIGHHMIALSTLKKQATGSNCPMAPRSPSPNQT